MRPAFLPTVVLFCSVFSCLFFNSSFDFFGSSLSLFESCRLISMNHAVLISTLSCFEENYACVG